MENKTEPTFLTGAQDGHLDIHPVPELCGERYVLRVFIEGWKFPLANKDVANLGRPCTARALQYTCRHFPVVVVPTASTLRGDTSVPLLVPAPFCFRFICVE